MDESNSAVPQRRAAKKAGSGSRTEFTSLKLNGTDYTIGDTVALKMYDDSEAYGTIERIYRSEKDSYAYVTLRWFYSPSDIFNSTYEFISAAELFDSDHTQDIWVQTIFMKIQVLTLEDYHSCDEVEHDVYFSRAKYNVRQAKVEPPFSAWRRVCICNKILNPDHTYTVCECGSLYHPNCISDEFSCTECGRSALLS